VNVSGNTVYAECPTHDPDGLETIAIDAINGKVVHKYVLGEYGGLEIDNGLWYSNFRYGGCTSPCESYAQSVYRTDADSGEVTFTLKDWVIADDGLGYVWARPADSSTATALKIDPVTTATSQIPWTYGDLTVACGSLWGFSYHLDPIDSPKSTTITRVDPDTGVALATFTENGRVVLDSVQGPDACWAEDYFKTADANTVSPGPEPTPPDTYQFVRIGLSGVEARSKMFAGDTGFGDNIVQLDGTFWRNYPGLDTCRYANEVQRLDPATWQVVGPVWCTGGLATVFTAADHVWELDYDAGLGLAELDIPLGPLTP
jgi:hypothetical protein